MQWALNPMTCVLIGRERDTETLGVRLLASRTVRGHISVVCRVTQFGVIRCGAPGDPHGRDEVCLACGRASLMAGSMMAQ